MSHQTGIQANEQLKKSFAKCRDGNVRLIKVSIENEQLSLAAQKEAAGTWEQDLDRLAAPLVEPAQPCYIIYRLDSKNTTGYDWLLISWCPDESAVRDKMLHASTKATLKREFGSAHITQEFHSTDEVSLCAYRKQCSALTGPGPLTCREEQLEEIKRSQVNTDVGVDSRQQTMSGVAFPVTDGVKNAVTDMIGGKHGYVQLRVDTQREEICLVEAGDVSVEQLPAKVPKDNARYHLYNFKHTHDGERLEQVVFIYSMPGYNCSIRERMLYSSCKGPLTDLLDTLGLGLAKKLEIDDGNELTEAFLREELHPQKMLHRPKFAKPKGPPNRGAKRMTKVQQSQQIC